MNLHGEAVERESVVEVAAALELGGILGCPCTIVEQVAGIEVEEGWVVEF